MKKCLLLIAIFATAILSANAADYFLDIPAIYAGITDGTITQVDPPTATAGRGYTLETADAVGGNSTGTTDKIITKTY